MPSCCSSQSARGRRPPGPGASRALRGSPARRRLEQVGKPFCGSSRPTPGPGGRLGDADRLATRHGEARSNGLGVDAVGDHGQAVGVQPGTFSAESANPPPRRRPSRPTAGAVSAVERPGASASGARPRGGRRQPTGGLPQGGQPRRHVGVEQEALHQRRAARAEARARRMTACKGRRRSAPRHSQGKPAWRSMARPAAPRRPGR